eukprot:scaffold45308_cov18-Tisochrysis_lutea.AAC.1
MPRRLFKLSMAVAMSQVTPVAIGSQNPTWNFAALFPLAVSQPPQPQAGVTELLEVNEVSPVKG